MVSDSYLATIVVTSANGDCGSSRAPVGVCDVLLRGLFSGPGPAIKAQLIVHQGEFKHTLTWRCIKRQWYRVGLAVQYVPKS